MNYLEYTNIVLQAVNEVPLTETQFSGTRGLHQFAQESINRTYFDIIGEYRWPWMFDGEPTSPGALELSGERSLTPVEQWTQIPVPNPYKDAIDWDTIYYRELDGTKRPLKVLTWVEFEASQKYYEDMTTYTRSVVQSADGKSLGLFPFHAEDTGKIYYRIWSRPSRFTFATDEIPMPDSHYNVLVDGALHHLWSFRGNVDQAQIAYQRFEKGMKKMKQKYTNQSPRMYWR